MDHLDVLTIHILELTPSVPLYAATTAIARLQRLHDRLHQRLVGTSLADTIEGLLLPESLDLHQQDFKGLALSPERVSIKPFVIL